MKILTIDIGGTYIKYGVYETEALQLSHVKKIKTPTSNQAELIDVIDGLFQKFSSIDGCAISMPGTIDHQSGFIYQGGALQYNNGTEFAKELYGKLGVPVTIENDARCAALAEIWQGKLQGVENGLVLVIGTGLGGAIVKNGVIYRGTHLYAGELSLLFTKNREQYGDKAVLGNQVGIPGFVAHLSKLAGEELEGPEAFSRIENGEEQLANAFKEYIENFSTQLFNFQLMYDPEKLLIGGGISKNSFYMNQLSDALEKFYETLPIKIRHAKIETCQFESEANLIGAVKNYLDLTECKSENEITKN